MTFSFDEVISPRAMQFSLKSFLWTICFKRVRQNLLVVLCAAVFTFFLVNYSISSGSGDVLEEVNAGSLVLSVRPSQVHCDAIQSARNDVSDLRSASEFALSESSILLRTSNCQNYFQSFDKVLKPKNRFPLAETIRSNLENLHSKVKDNEKPITRLAFSILVHENIGIFETLLHLIFRRYHSFCVHVDSKASRNVHSAVEGIVKCFKERYPNSNIFMADFSIPVYWGHVSMLDAELQCLQQLDERDSKWQFYFNLAGSELPLVDIRGIEEVLSKAPVNQSYLQSFPTPEKHENRFKFSHALGEREALQQTSRWYLFKQAVSPWQTHDSHYQIVPLMTENPKRPPPFNLTIYKGQKNVILSRTFAKFILNHPVAKGFKRWCEDMLIPDEAYYSTLYHITDVKEHRKSSKHVGNYLDDLEDRFEVEQNKNAQSQDIVSGYCVRRSLWSYDACKGEVKRQICNLGVDDLPIAVNAGCQKTTIPCFFVNKLDLNVDPLSITCLAQHVLASKHERC